MLKNSLAVVFIVVGEEIIYSFAVLVFKSATVLHIRNNEIDGVLKSFDDLAKAVSRNIEISGCRDVLARKEILAVKLPLPL